MSEVCLDFDFATDLLFNFRFHYLGLVETLEGDNVVWFDFGADHVYAAELPFPERSTNFKRM